MRNFAQENSDDKLSIVVADGYDATLSNVISTINTDTLYIKNNGDKTIFLMQMHFTAACKFSDFAGL